MSSSPENAGSEDAGAADEHSQLDSVSIDDKTKDSFISQEGSFSSKISDNPIEPNDGVLDFEVDAPDLPTPPKPKPDLLEDGSSNGKTLQAEDDDELLNSSKEEGENNDDDGGDQEEKLKKPEKPKKKRESDLEDGEVTDSDDDDLPAIGSKNKSDNDAKGREEKPPICRFFSRGQCTWGNQCRFIHSGSMSGANLAYSHHPRIFSGQGAFPPPGPFPPPAPVENAWERGLRNAKQLLKEASRRREEDPAFEDRRLHQGLQESPPRELPLRPSPSPSPPLRSKLYGTYEKHRDTRSVSPLNVDRWREERNAAASRPRPGPVDTWKDPWMRSKSPKGRARRRSRSSSSRSYSSSASSESSYSSSRSSSYSRSRSRDRRGGRPVAAPGGGRPQRGGLGGGGGGGGGRQRYPSERLGPGRLMASPSPTRYRSRNAPPASSNSSRARRRSSSSSSSSRSPSRSPRRRRYSRSRTPEGIPRRPRQASPIRGGATASTVTPPIKMNLLDKSKKLPAKRAFSASPSRSPSRSPKKSKVSPSPPPRSAPAEIKKKIEKKSDAAKREELMKQLKAVEDAIAKKKAKA